MARVTISLPEEMLGEVETKRRTSGESRSEFFRRAVEELMRREREREAVEQYVRSYRRQPETAEEIAIAESTLSHAMSQNPWEADAK